MEGGEQNVTCNDTNTADDELHCAELLIPDCVDRAVYCTFPPPDIIGGNITHTVNPSPVYLNESYGKTVH